MPSAIRCGGLFHFILIVSFFLERNILINTCTKKNLHFFPVAGSRIKRKLGLLAQGLPTVAHGPHVPFFAQIPQVTTEVSRVQLSTSNMHLLNQGINSTILIHSSISILWSFKSTAYLFRESGERDHFWHEKRQEVLGSCGKQAVQTVTRAWALDCRAC